MGEMNTGDMTMSGTEMGQMEAGAMHKNAPGMHGPGMHGPGMHRMDKSGMDTGGAHTSHAHPLDAEPGRDETAALRPLHPGDESHPHAHHEEEGGGIEWEDTMPAMNLMSTPTNMVWKLIDTETGAVNHDIGWRFHVGERVKIRLDNAAGSDHQMHHPFHIHGAGRFLVLSRGGEPEPNLVWKDTVLVRAGEVVDILLDVSNPGRWMAHCHIAEHNETGMMFSFDALQPEPTKVIR